MVLAIFMIGIPSFQNAHAVLDCTDPVLEPRGLFVGSSDAKLVKVDTIADPPEACTVGEIREDPSDDATFLKCDDVAIDHSDLVSQGGGQPALGQLYCIEGGDTLYKIDRCADFLADGTPLAAGTCTGAVVDATLVDLITLGATTQQFINAFEIDAYGEAYIAGGGLPTIDNAIGKFYNLDLTTAIATLRSDFNTAAYGLAAETLVSSGDLARDESTGFDIYWTVFCEDASLMSFTGGVGDLDEPCDDDANNLLFKIQLGQGPGGAGALDGLIRIAELPGGAVFAMEIIQPTFDICFLTTDFTNSDGDLFETTRDGTVTRDPVAVSPALNSFGATGNNVGGIPIMINVSSLAIAAAGIHSPWILAFAVSGAAVIAYQFTGKTKTRKKFKD